MLQCQHCGTRFEARYPNMKLCLPCWQKREYAFASYDRLQAALDRANQRLVEALNNRSRIPPDMLRRLIHLCHPDKHGNSQAATTVMQWLLEQREASK
jgi:hypothetical protein